jgi:acyl-CoA reductase-like NAD-dependent aldehyde dehydrogenase
MFGERRQPANSERATGRTSAFTAGLDDELHSRAEAAIAAFRSSFDAALAEGSQDVRQRLRQAASDLMRVAARTTIVLDRLNASAEREPMPAPDHARWSQGR